MNTTLASGKRWILILGAFFIIFVALHIPGVHSPYHQDEYKWIEYSHPEIIAPGTVPHPPLTEFLYTKIAPVFGDDNFRMVPFAFGILDFFLLFYLARIIFDRKTALWASALFTASYYSLLATLMVDVDGAVMPFFFLIMTIGYYKLRAERFKLKGNWKWLAMLIAGILGGFLIKVSFLLVIAACAFDFAVEKNAFSDIKKILQYAAYAAGGLLILVGVLVGAKFVFPFFKLGNAVKYWEHFAVFAGRGWGQTFIQFAKSILYTSPLLILPVAFADRDVWKKTRPFFFFIFFGLFFYLFAFDFSLGALDRYFQFLVVPLCVITAPIFTTYLSRGGQSLSERISIRNGKGKESILLIVLAALFAFFIQFSKQTTPPLYPKTEWLHRLVGFKWNFLFPFTGGSGPVPFYISFLFMALMWIASAALAVLALKRRSLREFALFGILVFGLVYNGVFIEEYLFGRINGSAPALVRDATSFIESTPDVKAVTVYNDTGGWNVMETGKYLKRLYIDPKFNIDDKIQTLNANKEFYMVIDIPHIDPSTVYARYFSTCVPAFQEQSGMINAFVYDCRNAPDIQ